MNHKLAAQMLEYIAATSELNDRLLKEAHDARSRQKQAADKEKAVLDTLVKSGAVRAEQISDARGMLKSHSQCLDLLSTAVQKMAEFRGAAEKAASAREMSLGAADSSKASVSSRQAAASSLTSPYVGRRTSEKKASDYALAAVLNSPR